MKMYDIIQKKKEGKALSREEISFFIRGFTDGTVPDYQASALLMAICFSGMEERETALLTDAMMHSGDVVDLSRFGDRSVDKHSTGGVGDKTTLILAPMVSAAGGVVAKMSGRGLGFTGGTVDKMEAIPGMKTAFSSEEFLSLAEKTGVCVAGQSGDLAPADKKLYALRDVTATIDSIPLIASSIMSKKLAAGSKNIVLDVKFGSGAFMKTEEEAVTLARWMVKIGDDLGRKVCALVTDMDAPLGTMVGNALEVREAIEILSGKGDEKLRALCVSLASYMLSLSLGVTVEEGRRMAQELLVSGKALQQMKKWIASQGGDASVVDHPEKLPLSSVSYDILSPQDGFLAAMNAQKVGETAMTLGAGRRTKEDRIDPGAGIRLWKQVGDRIRKGERLATLYTSQEEKAREGEAIYLSALVFSEEKPEEKPLIDRVIP